MRHLLIIICLLLSIVGCKQENYKDISSSENDISYYNLVEKKVIDDNGTVIKFSIPDEWRRVDNNLLEERTLTRYEFIENTGYIFSIDKLESKNTIKLNDKSYLDIMTEVFETEFDSDLEKVGRILPPSLKDVQVVSFVSNLIINGNYFGRRICYYKDGDLKDTALENTNVTECHFITLQNKRKYTINIAYYGDDKGVSSLIGIMNTIGGSVIFE